ncbi:MAG: AtpZ/AtpI family protein [Planctomycetota bacterium]|nr:AtpZ/AtpI family protein [Planctomycetota bacterium]
MGSDSPHGSGPQRAGADGRVPVDADGDRLPDGEWVASQREGASAMAAGLQFGAAICVFAFIGLKLDDALGTKPVLLAAGVLIGFTGGTISVLKKFK